MPPYPVLINTISEIKCREKFDLEELEGIERPLHTPYGYKVIMRFSQYQNMRLRTC